MHTTTPNPQPEPTTPVVTLPPISGDPAADQEDAAAPEQSASSMKSKRVNPLKSIKPESRIGLAAMLSFLILTGVLVYNKVRQPPTAKPTPTSTAKTAHQEKKESPASAPENPANPEVPPPPITLAIPGPAENQESQDPAVAQVAEAPPPPPILPTTAEVETGPNPTEAQPPPAASAHVEAPPPPALNVAAAQGEPPPLPTVADAAPALPPAQEASMPPLSLAEPAPPVPPPVEAIGAAAPRPDVAPLPVPTPTATNELPAPSPVMSDPPAAHAAIPSLTPAPSIASDLGAAADQTQYRPLPNAGKVALAVDKPLGAPRKVAAVTVAAAAAATGAAAARSTKPLAAESKARAIEPIEHIVQSGENFGTISKLYYGTLRYYRALWKANVDRVPAIDQLVVGTSVRIPPPEALDARLIDSRADQPAPKPATKRATPSSSGSSDSLVMLPIGKPSSIRPKAATLQPEPARPTHIVAERETLRGIARDTLGDAHRADEIYSLNRDVIEDPARLEPGTRLRLPADANGRSIRR